MLALITGATAGFGKATAELFASKGWNLVITGRRKVRLDVMEKNLKQNYGVQVKTLCFDVRKNDEVKAAIESLQGEWKDIDLLVNNAGLAVGLSTIQEGTLDDWERMIDTNIKGLLYMTRMIAPVMVARKKGHIINIGSVAGKEVYANGNVYCATKHAVDALNRAMRIDLLPHGIRVSQIAPGLAETEFSIVRFKGDDERAKKVYQGMQALTAEDIAETIFWVASRPAHVNILDVVITPAAQANSTTVIRK
ncbi:MAG: short-chain alcohol dehydrogenase [Bacteroidetes bacterium]|nr:MAG: short-chain alcohol dehydrogenase [Bacteroidota bacterium]